MILMTNTGYSKIKILIASPGDVAEERAIAKEVIKDWNTCHSDEYRLMLEAVLWESHGTPEMGDRVQGILNKQIVDQCDCAIGIFWTRIGTATGVAPGGAVEEIERLREMGKPVMMYFSDAPMPRKMVDLEQLKKLDDYRESLLSQGLVWQYETVVEFHKELSNHLALQVPKWFSPINERNPSAVVVSHQATNFGLLHLYQATLMRQLGNITLTGSPALEHFATRLSDTFVSLSLSGSVRSETRFCKGVEQCDFLSDERSRMPEQVMKVVLHEQNHPLLLIIGDPGSGKTTLLKHYALSCLNEQRYGDFGFSEPVNVFFLPLRELNIGDGSDISLADNLAAWAKIQFLAIDAAHFSDWLDQPSTLVLLDGLDEISDKEDRIAVCKWIDSTVGRFTKAKFVVTSRSTGYRKGDGIEIEADHLRADIMDFSPQQQAEFLHRWFKAAFCGEIPPAGDQEAWRTEQEQKATKKADAILAFLALEKNRGLRPLAGVPLLLQIMAMLWKEREYLPGSRLELYDAALNYLLDYRDRRRGLYPKLSAQDARRVLSPVSLIMQEELKKDEIDRLEMQQQMQGQLDTLYNSLPASDFCRNLVDRAGLLVEYGEKEYLFRHKSFREYMAGIQLLKNIHKQDSLNKLVSHFGDDWWTEVFRFFIGHVEDAELFDSFMQRLFDSPVTEELTQKQQDLLIALVEEAPQRKIDALRTKLLDPATTANRQRYLRECLKNIGKPEAIAALLEFKQSGLTKEQQLVKEVKYDKLGAEYIFIKGGTFPYSLTKKREPVKEMYVAKFTVTNQLFRRFISYLDAQEPELAERVPLKTYEERLQELGAGIKGFGDYLKEEPSLAKRFVSYTDTNKQFNKDDQPVAGVTWYAARAYCLWLSLLESDDALYRLPTEVEWEYAAAGEEGRLYPWTKKEGEPDKTLVNYNNNEGATTSVGRYPKGATPEGLHDMAGNVWEWTEDLYQKDKNWHAQRGGAYYSSEADALRCSSRGGGVPGSGSFDIVGFRVIRSSPSS
ncbi:MAG: SUMF1/EgtB/PvdO family nonheme iron enzyme [Chlorobium sp.]